MINSKEKAIVIAVAVAIILPITGQLAVAFIIHAAVSGMYAGTLLGRWLKHAKTTKK